MQGAQPPPISPHLVATALRNLPKIEILWKHENWQNAWMERSAIPAACVYSVQARPRAFVRVAVKSQDVNCVAGARARFIIAIHIR
jgi:hypothetical protein